MENSVFTHYSTTTHIPTSIDYTKTNQPAMPMSINTNIDKSKNSKLSINNVYSEVPDVSRMSNIEMTDNHLLTPTAISARPLHLVNKDSMDSTFVEGSKHDPIIHGDDEDEMGYTPNGSVNGDNDDDPRSQFIITPSGQGKQGMSFTSATVHLKQNLNDVPLHEQDNLLVMTPGNDEDSHSAASNGEFIVHGEDEGIGNNIITKGYNNENPIALPGTSSNRL